MDYYSKNTACFYRIRLPRTFYLKGEYEVALALETFTKEEDYRFQVRIGEGIIPISVSAGF